MQSMTLLDLSLRVATALILGGLIGLDRSTKEKTAGIRTMMLVSLGSAGAVILGLEFTVVMTIEGIPRPDPTRVVAGVVGGIGFLGAGAIIQSRGSVKGMTTAATIWAVAALGMCAGAGLYEATIAMFVGVMVTLVIVTGLKRKLMGRDGKVFGEDVINSLGDEYDEEGEDEDKSGNGMF